MFIGGASWRATMDERQRQEIGSTGQYHCVQQQVIYVNGGFMNYFPAAAAQSLQEAHGRVGVGMNV